jgi:hypothetical protein
VRYMRPTQSKITDEKVEACDGDGGDGNAG